MSLHQVFTISAIVLLLLLVLTQINTMHFVLCKLSVKEPEFKTEQSNSVIGRSTSSFPGIPQPLPLNFDTPVSNNIMMEHETMKKKHKKHHRKQKQPPTEDSNILSSTIALLKKFMMSNAAPIQFLSVDSCSMSDTNPDFTTTDVVSTSSAVRPRRAMIFSQPARPQQPYWYNVKSCLPRIMNEQSLIVVIAKAMQQEQQEPEVRTAIYQAYDLPAMSLPPSRPKSMFQLGKFESNQIPQDSILNRLILPYMNFMGKVMSLRSHQSSILNRLRVTLRRMPKSSNKHMMHSRSSMLRGSKHKKPIQDESKKKSWIPLVAIWDMTDPSDTQLFLHDQFFRVFTETGDETFQSTSDQTITKIFEDMLEIMPAEITKDNLMKMVRGMSKVFSKLSSSPSAICLACMVVLSMFMPLLLNYVCYYIAEAMCPVLHLSDDQCMQMEVASLAVVVVLILPTAFVIWRLCHKTVCGNSMAYIYQTGAVALGTLYSSLRNMV